MEQLYEKYTNIQLFATSPKYRGYKLLDKEFYNYEEFKSKMQIISYIQHKFHDQRHQTDIDIYLFKHDSKYITSTTDFKKILDKYTSASIIMITKEELNIYRRKSINQYPNLNIKNYLHKHFIMEMNKGPLCSKHTVLSPEEVRRVCYSLKVHAHKLPAISAADPQNIWIGGEINDLIKIEAYSEITGHSIHYRIVTPASGKVLQNSTIVKKDATITEIDEEQSDVEIEDNNEDYIDDYEEVEEDDAE